MTSNMTSNMTSSPLAALSSTIAHMPGDYVRFRDNVIWSASLSTIVVATTTLTLPDITVPTSALQSALKSLRGDDVRLEATPTTLKLTTQHSRAQIGLAGTVIGYINVPDDMWQTVDRDVIAAGLRAVSSAVGVGDVPNAGVRLCAEGVVATDTCRLHWHKWAQAAPIVGTLHPESVSVLTGCLSVGANTGKKAKQAAPTTIRYAAGQKFLVFDTGTLRVYCRRLPEPWAPWERIVAGEPRGVRVIISAAQLNTALKNVPAIFVDLSSDGDGLKLDYAIGETGEGSNSVDASCNAFPPVRYFVRYLLDAVACCSGEVEMWVSEGAAMRLRSGSFEAAVMFAR